MPLPRHVLAMSSRNVSSSLKPLVCSALANAASEDVPFTAKCIRDRKTVTNKTILISRWFLQEKRNMRLCFSSCYSTTILPLQKATGSRSPYKDVRRGFCARRQAPEPTSRPAVTSLSEEELALKEHVSVFAKEVIGPKVREMDDKGEMHPDVIAACFDMGIMGIEAPVEYGGVGLGFTAACVVIEEIAKVDPAVAVMVDIHNTLNITAFNRYATHEQKEKYFPRLCQSSLSSFCLSESGSGSDAFALKTKAEWDEASQMLGKRGQGYKMAIELLNEGRIGIGAQMVGLALGAFENTLPYLHERKQFGRTVADFQGMQFQYARALMEIEAAKVLVYNAARLKEAKAPFVMEAAMAKLKVTDIYKLCSLGKLTWTKVALDLPRACSAVTVGILSELPKCVTGRLYLKSGAAAQAISARVRRLIKPPRLNITVTASESVNLNRVGTGVRPPSESAALPRGAPACHGSRSGDPDPGPGRAAGPRVCARAAGPSLSTVSRTRRRPRAAAGPRRDHSAACHPVTVRLAGQPARHYY
eukprot:749178-Hanusia_phi.AAC.1